MAFLPQEIAIKEFVPTLRGYSIVEVRSFLRAVAVQQRDLRRRARRAEQRVEELEKELVHLRDRYRTLRDYARELDSPVPGILGTTRPEPMRIPDSLFDSAAAVGPTASSADEEDAILTALEVAISGAADDTALTEPSDEPSDRPRTEAAKPTGPVAAPMSIRPSPVSSAPSNTPTSSPKSSAAAPAATAPATQAVRRRLREVMSSGRPRSAEQRTPAPTGNKSNANGRAALPPSTSSRVPAAPKRSSADTSRSPVTPAASSNARRPRPASAPANASPTTAVVANDAAWERLIDPRSDKVPERSSSATFRVGLAT